MLDYSIMATVGVGFSFSFTYKVNNVAQDVSTWSATLTATASGSGTTVFTLTSPANISLGSNGVVTVTVPASNVIAANNGIGYTVDLKKPDNTVVAGYIGGKFYVNSSGATSGGGGTGGISTINSKSPDGNGNVQLTYTDVGALNQTAADARYDALNAASTAVTNHVNATDPHTGYLNNARGDARYDAAGTADNVSSTLSNKIAGSIGVVFKQSGTWPTRPTGYGMVSWRGAAPSPTIGGSYAVDGVDEWIDLS